MLPHLSCDRPQYKLVIDATERDQFFQLLRVGGSKTMPHEMDAFVGGIETALTRYHQRKAEDYRRRSAREDLRELFMLCADAKNIAKIRTKFLHLPVFARGELVHRARVRSECDHKIGG